MMTTPTWRDIAGVYPQFMEWVVKKYGPMPEGPADAESIREYMGEYDREAHSKRFHTSHETKGEIG